MIGKVIRGSRTAGLLSYLYGPGEHEEHLQPRLVASWSGRETDPARSGSVQNLAGLLDQPVRLRELEIGRPVDDHVWHYPLRAAPTDPILPDEVWGSFARRIVAAARLAPEGDVGGCRWVAVRHANDHIHIVATLARTDGGTLDHHNDARRARAEILRIERDHGLRSTAPADRTARRTPGRKELNKAARHGQEIPVRELLHAEVQDAALSARNEQEFFAIIQNKGLRLNLRLDDHGDVVGYSVAMPGDRAFDGRPIFYSGGRLAPDLSLPRVRERLRDYAAATAGQPPGQAPLPTPAEQIELRAQAWERAAMAANQAAGTLPTAGPADGAATVAAIGDLLSAAAQRAPVEWRAELRAAATSFERAARTPNTPARSAEEEARRQHAWQAVRDLRVAVVGVARAGQAFSNGRETAAVFLLVVSAIAAVRATYHWYKGRGSDVQAEAAQAAMAHLRAAIGLPTVNPSPAAPYDSRAAALTHLQHAVRTALPDRASTILADPAWPALAAVLRQVERTGRPVAEVLAEIAAQRTLDGVDSTARVLTWRGQRWLAQHVTDTPPQPVNDPAAPTADPDRAPEPAPPSPAAPPPGHAPTGDAPAPTAREMGRFWDRLEPVLTETIGPWYGDVNGLITNLPSWRQLVTTLIDVERRGGDIAALLRTAYTQADYTADRATGPVNVAARIAERITELTAPAQPAQPTPPTQPAQPTERTEHVQDATQRAADHPNMRYVVRLNETGEHLHSGPATLPADDDRPLHIVAADLLINFSPQNQPRDNIAALEKGAGHYIIELYDDNPNHEQPLYGPIRDDEAGEVRTAWQQQPEPTPSPPADGRVTQPNQPPPQQPEPTPDTTAAGGPAPEPVNDHEPDTPLEPTEVYAPVIRSAAAGYADPELILTDPAWPILADVLRQTEEAGFSVHQVLTEVAQPRSPTTQPDRRVVAASLGYRVRQYVAAQRAQQPPQDPAAADGRSSARRHSDGHRRSHGPRR